MAASAPTPDPTSVTLGIDLGTGSTKVGLIDADGRLLTVGRHPHRLTEPRPGWSEIDANEWLVAVGAAAGRALSTVDGQVRVEAIGFSGQMHGVVVCGPDLVPLRPAILWSDRRAEPDLARLSARLEQAGLRLANPIVAGMAGPILAAIGRLEPDLAGGIRTVVQPKDWLRGRLSGEVATDPSDASATLLWDVDHDRWSDESTKVFGVDRRWLPPVLASDDRAGTLNQVGAELLGLPAGIPIMVGAADTAAGLLGAGVALGETQISTGTGGQIARLLDRPVVDNTSRTHLYRAAGSQWYAMAAIQNAGLAIDWALGVLGADQAEIDAVMTADDQRLDHGLTFLPYLTGERTPHLDSGLTGRWVGLRSNTDRSALIRSVFEGVVFALRDGIEALRDAGHPIDQALLAGGGSVAPWWRQLLADGLELPMIPHDATDASVRGAGLLAWAGLESAGRQPIDPAKAVSRAEPVVASPAGVAALARRRERFLAAGPIRDC